MKLLNRTVRSYVIYSCLLLLVAIPAFYFVLSRLVIREIDEVLLSHKRDFIKAAANFRSLDDLEHYPLLNEEFFITPAPALVATDSFYTEHIPTSYEPKPIPFRVVRTSLMIQGQPYELLVKESLMESKHLITTIIYTQTALIVALLTGLILINRGQSKRIWRPFYDMLQRLKHYDIHQQKKIELDRSEINEFEDMRQAISQLLVKNQQAYLYQKEFTENASHEIQTPLAIVTTKLEMLMQTDKLTPDQAGLIHDVYEATHQLSRLNKNLLLLTKIENTQYRALEAVSVQDVVGKITHALQPSADEKGLTFDVTGEDFLLTVNVTQLEILISNLVGNAVKHSTAEGTIQVQLENNSIQISNPGTPLRNPEKIFDRFQRDATTTTGSGLGLAIVSRICELNGYHITYAYNNGLHHFSVAFAPR